MIDDLESTTAKLCSFARAYHSNYERNKVFDDYLAYDVMGRDEYEEIGQLIENDFILGKFNGAHSFCKSLIRSKLNELISPIVLSRASFTEEELKKFAKERGKCQYVICGAGMDTFSFRNDNPQIEVFEIDHPDTQKYKLKKIKELEWNILQNVHFVPVDFSKDNMIEKLIGSGYDVNLPSFFAILGVTYYLTLETFEKTLKMISDISSYGSKVAFDFPDETTFYNKVERVEKLLNITEYFGERMLYGYSVSEIENITSKAGYLFDEHLDPKKIHNRFFKDRDDGQRAFENIHFVLLTKGDSFNDSYYLYI